jgi:K+ transporter
MEEEGATARTLLLEPKLDNRDHGGVVVVTGSESSSPTTFILVLSTLVATGGSYTFGNGVSTPSLSFRSSSGFLVLFLNVLHQYFAFQFTKIFCFSHVHHFPYRL